MDGPPRTTINLLRVSWNFHPSATCAKHELTLSYGTPTATPLSLAVVGTVMLLALAAQNALGAESRSQGKETPSATQFAHAFIGVTNK